MTGNRFNYQLDPRGQQGGLSYYPFSGIVSGLTVTAAVANGTDNVNLAVTITAGAARLDGKYHSLAANISALILPVGADVAVGTQKFEIWLNPRRVVPALTSAPGGPATGDKYLKVRDQGEYLEVTDFLQYNGSAWLDFDPVRGSAPGYGFNNLPMNEINTVIDTATTSNKSFSFTPEKAVYHGNNYPQYVAAPSKAHVRLNAGVKLADITMVSGTATIVNHGDQVRLAL
jgi:hypothetical protein